ncbi:MAG: hypothetical protein ACXWNE_09920, partial [Candidatus Binataceae bacterium]
MTKKERLPTKCYFGLIEKGSSPKRSASSVILREARLRAESKDPDLFLATSAGTSAEKDPEECRALLTLTASP